MTVFDRRGLLLGALAAPMLLRPPGFMPITDASPAAITSYIEAQAPVWQELVRVSGARIE